MFISAKTDSGKQIFGVFSGNFEKVAFLLYTYDLLLAKVGQMLPNKFITRSLVTS
jgi:hypothetical protein